MEVDFHEQSQKLCGQNCVFPKAIHDDIVELTSMVDLGGDEIANEEDSVLKFHTLFKSHNI